MHKSKTSIIMRIENELMHIIGHMLREIVLWLSKPSKQIQVCLNNHKHKFTTQHVNAITFTTKSLHITIAKAFN